VAAPLPPCRSVVDSFLSATAGGGERVTGGSAGYHAERAAKAEAEVERLTEERDRLRSVLGEIARCGTGNPRTWWDGKRCGEVARAALSSPPVREDAE
jgi:hypothetical protein